MGISDTEQISPEAVKFPDTDELKAELQVRSEKDTWTFEEDGWRDTLGAMRMGVPLMVGSMSKMSQQLIVSMLLGRNNTVLLASVSVAGIFSAWMDEAMSQGATQAGVLCGQAYGAGNYKLVGTWLQMQLLFMTACFPVVLLLKFSTGTLIAFFGVSKTIAEPAGIYATWSSFACIFELWYNAIFAYFLAQGVVTPDAVINIVFIVVTSIFIYFGVYFFSWGIYGVAIAMSLKRFLRCNALVWFCVYMGYHKKTWHGWDLKECLRKERWTVLLGMTVPAMIGTVFEQSQWMVNSIFAARLGPASSASYDLVIILLLLLYQAVYGMSQGFGTTMAQSLGKGLPNRAFGVVKMGAIAVYALVICAAALTYFFMPAFAALSSHDPEVREQVADVRFVGALQIFMVGGMFMWGEVLIKQGRLGIVFGCIIGGQWMVGLPLAGFLAPIYGIKGIFAGNIVSYTFVHFFFGYKVVFTTDWVEMSRIAMQNAEVVSSKDKPADALLKKDRSRSSSFADDSTFTLTITKVELMDAKHGVYAQGENYDFTVHERDEQGKELFKVTAEGNGTQQVHNLAASFTTKSPVVAFKSRDRVTTVDLRSFRGKPGEQEATIDMLAPWTSEVAEHIHVVVKEE